MSRRVHALDVGVLGLEHLGHQVVGGVLGPPVDVLLEHLRLRLRVVHAEVGHLAGVEPQALVDAVAERLLVLLGDAEQHADRAHRHLGAEVGDEVEAAAADQRVEAAGAELAHLGLDRRHLAGGEHPRQQAPVEVVVGRVLEDDRPRRDLHAALDELEDRALGRAVGAPVDEAPLDVLEAAQRVEVVALVVVEGLLVAQAPPHRVRVGVDVEVERVVVDVGLRRRHRCLPLTSRVAWPVVSPVMSPARPRSP